MRRRSDRVDGLRTLDMYWPEAEASLRNTDEYSIRLRAVVLLQRPPPSPQNETVKSMGQ